MDVDEAMKYAAKEKGFWSGEVHTALETLAAEVKRLRGMLPPTATTGVRPSEGSWSVFAEKVAQERDEARAEVGRLRSEVARMMGEREKIIRLGPHPIHQVEGEIPLDVFIKTRFVQVWEYNELADKAERLRCELAETKADVENLNKMLRDTGYGQGQIDCYVAQCEELDQLKAELAAAKAASVCPVKFDWNYETNECDILITGMSDEDSSKFGHWLNDRMKGQSNE